MAVARSRRLIIFATLALAVVALGLFLSARQRASRRWVVLDAQLTSLEDEHWLPITPILGGLPPEVNDRAILFDLSHSERVKLPTESWKSCLERLLPNHSIRAVHSQEWKQLMRREPKADEQVYHEIAFFAADRASARDRGEGAREVDDYLAYGLTLVPELDEQPHPIAVGIFRVESVPEGGIPILSMTFQRTRDRSFLERLLGRPSFDLELCVEAAEADVPAWLRGELQSHPGRKNMPDLRHP